MPGKVALITGAGSGIGRAVALALDRRGYRLVLAGRRVNPLLETQARLGGETTVRPTDVTDGVSVQALFSHAVERFGRVDLLFNNAGVSGPNAPIGAVEARDWRVTIDTNLTGAFLCLQAAFRLMKAQNPRGGRIINNGSLAAAVPRPHAAAYAASKHGVTALTKSASLEGRPFDIACGQIDIGNAATSMAESATIGALQADGTRLPEPAIALENIGEAVAYMDSLPLAANVQFMTVMATKMPFIGRG